ncbi:MAG: hypothetical protein SFX73_26355 [Kofleriaceae bacterium]|nr:hypothetical protein [Kofleriaceae bacterium]
MCKRTILIALALVVAACKSPKAPGTPTKPPTELGDPTSETIGGISLGTTAARVEAILGPAYEKGPAQEMAATAETISTWRWNTGVTLTMSETPPPLKVHSINIVAPSKLTTSRGVGIGTTRAEVERIYKAFLGTGRQPDEPDHTSPESLIIGSVYGGTFFSFADGKVTEIFVGAGAE